jgi:hypothetical protein
MRRAIMTGAVPLLAACLLGADCEDTTETEEVCAADNTVVVDRSAIEAVDGAWASSPWVIEDPETEGLIEIAPGWCTKLLHGLDHEPIEIQTYVGFSDAATWVMPAAGNAAEIRDVGADDPCDRTSCGYVTIRNGSGGSFFYRFVLR